MEKRCVHPDLRPPSRIFALTFLMVNGQWPQPQSQKRVARLETLLFSPLKNPTQREAETIHSLFVNVEGKSSQDRNNPKNSVKCEHFLFGLGDLVQKRKNKNREQENRKRRTEQIHRGGVVQENRRN